MVAAGGGPDLGAGLPGLPRLRPADAADDDRGAGVGILLRPCQPVAHPLQHDRVQLVRRGADPVPRADRDADAAHGAPHADPQLLLHRLHRGWAHPVLHRRSVLADRSLPARARSDAGPAVQRHGLGDLHQPGRLPRRAERVPGLRYLPRSPAPAGLRALGRAFQPGDRGGAAAGGLRAARRS